MKVVISDSCLNEGHRSTVGREAVEGRMMRSVSPTLKDKKENASGKRQIAPATPLLTLDAGKIKEAHHHFDKLSLLQQIGAMPE
jgi:hypothetical protein